MYLVINMNYIYQFIYLVVLTSVIFLIFKIEKQKIIEEQKINNKTNINHNLVFNKINNKINNNINNKINKLYYIFIVGVVLLTIILIKFGLEINVFNAFTKFISLLVKIYNLWLYKYLLSKEEIKEFELRKKEEELKAKEQQLKVNKYFTFLQYPLVKLIIRVTMAISLIVLLYYTMESFNI